MSNSPQEKEPTIPGQEPAELSVIEGQKALAAAEEAGRLVIESLRQLSTPELKKKTPDYRNMTFESHVHPVGW